MKQPKKKSWKTTLMGCLVAAWVVIEPMVNAEDINWQTILKATAITIAGFLVKDFNVTGDNSDE